LVSKKIKRDDLIDMFMLARLLFACTLLSRYNQTVTVMPTSYSVLMHLTVGCQLSPSKSNHYAIVKTWRLPVRKLAGMDGQIMTPTHRNHKNLPLFIRCSSSSSRRSRNRSMHAFLIFKNISLDGFADAKIYGYKFVYFFYFKPGFIRSHGELNPNH